jgi:hypothetical protein
MSTATQIPIIGEEEHCYGYLTGLGVEDPWSQGSSSNPTLYASFCLAGRTLVWIVPDVLLFKKLTKALYSMALNGDCQEMGGLYKLEIFKSQGTWFVQPYLS